MAVRSLQRLTGLHVRRCLRCGYAGDEFQLREDERGPVDVPPLVCPNCCEDLYARPPRSYAEMEGISRHSLAQEEVRLSAKRWARRAYRTECAILITLALAAGALLIWQFVGM